MNPENFPAPAACPDARGEVPVVGLVVATDGGAEGWRTLAHAEETLRHFGLRAERWETDALATDRDDRRQHLADAAARGWRAVIVGSPDGRLPQALAAAWTVPVIRVPVLAADGADALGLLWPEGDNESSAAGAAFATVAIGEAGAKNAALLVVAMLALNDPALRRALETFRQEQTAAVLASVLPEQA